MKDWFTLQSENGLEVIATLSRHTDDCWRYALMAGDAYVGDILFWPRSDEVMHLIEIKIQTPFRGVGLGTALLSAMLADWRLAGYQRVEGAVVAERTRHRDVLVAWYTRFGGVVSPRVDPGDRRLAGDLVITLCGDALAVLSPGCGR